MTQFAAGKRLLAKPTVSRCVGIEASKTQNICRRLLEAGRVACQVPVGRLDGVCVPFVALGRRGYVKVTQRGWIPCSCAL